MKDVKFRIVPYRERKGKRLWIKGLNVLIAIITLTTEAIEDILCAIDRSPRPLGGANGYFVSMPIMREACAAGDCADQRAWQARARRMLLAGDSNRKTDEIEWVSQTHDLI